MQEGGEATPKGWQDPGGQVHSLSPPNPTSPVTLEPSPGPLQNEPLNIARSPYSLQDSEPGQLSPLSSVVHTHLQLLVNDPGTETCLKALLLVDHDPGLTQPPPWINFSMSHFTLSSSVRRYRDLSRVAFVV